MSSPLPAAPPVQPTRSAPLVRLLAYTQRLGLEPYLDRGKRGLSTLMLSLVWLILAWQGSGRPHHLRQFSDPFLAALLGVARLPTPQTLHRSLTYFSAQAIRAAVAAAPPPRFPRPPPPPPPPDLASQSALFLGAAHPRRRGSGLPRRTAAPGRARLGRARLAPGALLGSRPAGGAVQGLVGPAQPRAARLPPVPGHRYR